MAGFLVGLLATFLFVRINTRLIRAKVSWWFHDIESEGGTHVHHMVIGVVLMASIGILLIALVPDGTPGPGPRTALRRRSRADAGRVRAHPAPAGRLLAQGGPPLCRRGDHRRLCRGALRPRSQPVRRARRHQVGSNVARAAVALFILVDVVPVVFCLMKGKIWTGVVGLFVPLLAFVGAIRLARPNSPWARRRYPKRPKKLAKAQKRGGAARRAHHRLAGRVLRPHRRQAAPAVAAAGRPPDPCRRPRPASAAADERDHTRRLRRRPARVAAVDETGED